MFMLFVCEIFLVFVGVELVCVVVVWVYDCFDYVVEVMIFIGGVVEIFEVGVGVCCDFVYFMVVLLCVFDVLVWLVLVYVL